ncbi:hypothetical protein RB597_008688 [Gaeumannomyces tritici]
MTSPVSRFSPFSPTRRGRSSGSVHSQEPAAHDASNGVSALSPPSHHDARRLSSLTTASHREPIRSFIHGSVRDQPTPVDSAQYARSVREDTAELASYLLSDQSSRLTAPAFLNRQRSNSNRLPREVSRPSSNSASDDVEAGPTRDAGSTQEVPDLPFDGSLEEEDLDAAGPSIISNMLRRSPPEFPGSHADLDGSPAPGRTLHVAPTATDSHDWEAHHKQGRQDVEAELLTETTPLLSVRSHHSPATSDPGLDSDLEDQKFPQPRPWHSAISNTGRRIAGAASSLVDAARDQPTSLNRRSMWETLVVAPVSCLPAVIVGLLLNILDALSYGMILFPLGDPVFASLGPAGISIFYVSTIVSQVTYSTGSVFRGGIGSELIEVVPFFHAMAFAIHTHIGDGNDVAVIASTIVAYALSSMLTGLVFYLMGLFRFGYLVGFIPRHILVGCIGGVGWFLVATGFEVSARIDGSLEYNLETLHKLSRPDTIPLWATPLVLALVLFYCQKKIQSKFFLPLYICGIPVAFYSIAFALGKLDMDALREAGWVFKGPAANEPWWHFYTLYDFTAVRWDAVVQTIPAMFALTFFGILHVPINVPALAISTGEDNVDLNHELKLHGYSNFLSGLCGSIQNYLVYANTVFFMRSGADSRLAGFELAALTTVVMMIGPKLIGYIPILMVGCLIFDLGFELLLEALWSPRKKLKRLEYLTVVAIVLIMGIYDFVTGIGVGILMAFVSMIFQTAQVSAVRAGWSGDVVGSTVRRNPSQQHFLQQVGRQISIVKLSGYLFFGTIVGVEETIRDLITDEAFRQRPIKFLILDLHQVTGLDYSAGEAFATIRRLLSKKGIEFILSGVDGSSALCHNLRALGVGEDEATLLPDLNSALEACENELLKTLYAQQEAVKAPVHVGASSLEVPTNDRSPGPLEQLASSPRRNHLYEAATRLADAGKTRQSKWQSFREPLRLMLQIFQDMSDKNEDFWFRASSYFTRKEYRSGDVLYRQREPATGFYLVESGIIRMEYDLPQGYLCESIVAGTTCGELPFFSETNRTATAVVERDCVVWLIDREGWDKLQKEESDVAQELLRMGLKLTSERMSVMTSYVLTVAS